MTLRDEFVYTVVITSFFLVGIDVNNLIVKVAGTHVKKLQVLEKLELVVRSLEASSANLTNVVSLFLYKLLWLNLILYLKLFVWPKESFRLGMLFFFLPSFFLSFLLSYVFYIRLLIIPTECTYS